MRRLTVHSPAKRTVNSPGPSLAWFQSAPDFLRAKTLAVFPAVISDAVRQAGSSVLIVCYTRRDHCGHLRFLGQAVRPKLS